MVINTSLKVGTSFNGLAAFTNGLFRQAISSDLPGILNALSQLANGNGALRNNGSGTVSWEAVLPIASYSPTTFADFGDTNDASSYPMTANKGLALTDARALNWRGGFLSTDTFWGVSQDAGAPTSFKPFILADGSGAVWYKNDPQDASFKHYFTGNMRIAGDVDATGEIKQGSTVVVGLSRAGSLSSLRLDNLNDGQIPVANSSRVLVASGLTDDGTFLDIPRTIRAWNSMARSGNTWTDLQWNQDTQERVSVLSSNGTGVGAYHTITLVPADAEVSGRGLGVLQWGQKVSGKSGTNPGLKVSLLADSIGTGGAVGGFGGKFRVRYRPDNGSDLTDALRVGAFGGGTVDAVETAILLRATAGFQSNSIKDTSLSSGMVKSFSGTLQQAVANTDYLPVNNSAMTGIGTYQRQKTGITTISTSSVQPLSTATNQFINVTYAGMATIRLYTPGTDIAGIVYKIHCNGCTSLKFTMDTAGSMLWLNDSGGASNYWYQEAGTEHTFTTNANQNKTCDVWTDGTTWYIRW